MSTQNWILFKCMFDSLYGLLFVLTRSSCAPSTLFGFCFCSFPVKAWLPFHWPQWSCQENVWWHFFLVAGNHPTCSSLWSVKWEALPFFSKRFWVAICRAQPQTQVAVCMGKACLKPSTSKCCGTFLNHPRSWFLPQQHWSVPWHVILWQKILVILTATVPLTVLTISQEYSGKRGTFRQTWSRLSRELLESFPILAGLHTFWFVSLPDTWDRLNRTHSEQPGGGEHSRTLTTLNRVCWGWACCRANHYVSSRAVLKSYLMSYSALVILSAWFRSLLCGNWWNKSKALLGATAHSQLCRPSQGLKPQAYIPTNQNSGASIKTSCEDAKEILEQTSCNSHCHAEYSFSCWPFQLMSTQNWILFKCMFDSLYGLLFVLTRSSCAPSTLFGFCFCSFPVKAWLPCHWPQWSYQQNVWWHLFLVAGKPPNLLKPMKGEVRSPSFLFLKDSELQFAGHSHRHRLQCVWGRLVWNPLQASAVESSWIIPAHDSYPSSIGLSRDNFTQTPKKKKNEFWNLAMLGRVAKPIFTSLCPGQPLRVWVCWGSKSGTA